MSLSKYPHYKDSGVAGLGLIPAHWCIARLSRVMSAIKDGTHGTFQRVANGMPLLSAKNVLDGRLEVGASESLISDEDHAQIVSNGFPVKGDLLLTIVGTIGRSCVYEESTRIAFQRSVCFIRLHSNFVPKFFNYVTQSKHFQEQLAGRSKSAAQAGVYMGEVAALNVLFPLDTKEQAAITEFLDRETGKIDALVEEQEKLLTLLAEKRPATISYAVTRGLNPDAPMKDSGSVWLGKVPAHWEVLPAKRIASVFVPQRNKPNLNDEGDGLCWATMEDMQGLRLSVTQWWVSVDAMKEAGSRALPPGAVIASCVGNFGVATINDVEVIINQQLQAYVLRRDFNAEYLRYHVAASKAYFEQVGTSATLIYVNQKGFENLPVPCPSVEEQGDIVNFLNGEMSRLRSLELLAEDSIELLKERRSALIAAAVTGKIDVREKLSMLEAAA